MDFSEQRTVTLQKGTWTQLGEKYVGSSRGDLYISLHMRLEEQDVGGNRSKIIYNVSGRFTGGHIFDNQGEVGCGGTGAPWSQVACVNINGSASPTTLHSTSGWVSHNKDGTCTVSGSVAINFPNFGWHETINGNAIVPTIPRGAVITDAPNFTDNDSPTITYSNPAGDSVTNLEACISLTGSKDDISYRAISKTGTKYTFYLTESEKNILRRACNNSNSTTVKFFLRTTYGSTSEFTAVERVFTIGNTKINISANIYETISEYINLTGSNRKIIKGYNDIKVDVSASPQQGASIKECKIINANQTSFGTSVYMSNIENPNFTFIVEDSRGNTSLKQQTVDMVDYVKLTVNLEKIATNVDGEMSFKISGKYFNGSFGYSYNSLTLQYRYKENNGYYGSWQTVTPSYSGNTYNKTVVLRNLNYRSDYTVQARAMDRLNTSGVMTNEINLKIAPVFDWGSNDFNFNVPVTFQGKKLIDLIYPVGSIYMSVNSVNPQTLFGGTWVRWGNGRVPVGIDTSQTDFNTPEKTGGTKTHNHDFRIAMRFFYGSACGESDTTTGAYRFSDNSYGGWRNSMPATSVTANTSFQDNNKYATALGQCSDGNTSYTNNMQPYITCYMWKRTA